MQGIEPAPERKRQTTWKTFIQAHWDVLAAIDFTTIEVWTRGGLVTYYLLMVMEIAMRRVYFAGATPNPDSIWMQQIARNLTDVEEGFYVGLRPVEQRRGSRLYVIAYFTVKNVHNVTTSEPWPPATLTHLWANAHFRRKTQDDGWWKVHTKTVACSNRR